VTARWSDRICRGEFVRKGGVEGVLFDFVRACHEIDNFGRLFDCLLGELVGRTMCSMELAWTTGYGNERHDERMTNNNDGTDNHWAKERTDGWDTPVTGHETHSAGSHGSMEVRGAIHVR